MEDSLLQAEHTILSHHGDRWRRWVDEQRFLLQHAAALDRDALSAQASLCKQCFELVRGDVDEQRAAKDTIRQEAQASVDGCERAFREELQFMGVQYAAEVSDLVSKAKAKIRRAHDACESKEWDHLDRALRAVMLKHAQEHHGFGVVDGVAELWQGGEFQSHLDEELEGWTKSQRSDITHLHASIDSECAGALQALETRLKGLTPEAILSQKGIQQLAQMAAAEAKRLEEIETDLWSRYEKEIEEALEKCDKSYRQYDCELQQVLTRTLELRTATAASMRQYRLALCRWRLDYQQAFHELRAEIEPPKHRQHTPPTGGGGPARRRRRADMRQLENLRRLVQSLWTRTKPPVSEVSRFLGGVAQAAARAGLAAPLLRVYEEELRRHGALPLLEHAHRPELLDCWLQALQSPRGSMAAETQG